MKKIRFWLFLLIISTLILSACAPQTVVETVVVEKEGQTVIETVVVEKEGETIIETVEVEKVVEVQVTPVPEQPGKHLIGELGGATVVTDPAAIPASFNEAPMLAEKVSAGELPPVAERLPAEPLVLQPFEAIGTYGGTLHRGFTGPGDAWNGKRFAVIDRPLFYDYTMNKVVPNLAKGYEFQDDGKTIVLYLREGLKWSDGAPLTADDFMFWYEKMYQNEAIVGSPTVALSVNGKPGVMEKIDDFTIAFKFEDPHYLFPEVLASFANIASHSSWGFSGMGGFAPAHYLEQFHPDFVPMEELEAAAAEEGFDGWVNYFLAKNKWELNPDLPVATPWKTVVPINNPTWVIERNPYYFAVDTEGNQLPYIDQVTFAIAEDLEVLNLRAIAGEYDFQARHVDLQKLPLYLENQERGGYKVYLDPGAYGSNVQWRFNMTYNADEEMQKWFRNKDFRHAVSLGFDRDQINEAFFLGIGTPGSPIPSPENPYYPGDDYRTLWHSKDIEQANQLLDSIGLDQKDGEGYRLRSDGAGRLTIEVEAISGSFVPYDKIAEMLKEQLKEIGIDMEILAVERSLAEQRHQNNEHQVQLWDNGNTDRMFSTSNNLFPIDAGNAFGPLWGAWFVSAGAEGEEPEPAMKDWMLRWQTAPSLTEEERVELGKDLWKIYVEETWAIGLVGLSPATMGVRIVNVDLGNVAPRMIFGTDPWTPSISHPSTLYFK